MSELSDISTENARTAGSPTDNTMMHGVTEKTATSASFSEQVKSTLGKFFPFTMGLGTGDKIDTQEGEEGNEKFDDFEPQVSPNSSTHENEASTNMETGYSYHFGVVRTINTSFDGIEQSREFMTKTILEVQPGKNRNTGSSITPAEPAADYEETSRQRGKTRVSTTIKLPETNRVTPPLRTP